jgi:hypothetical protein
MISTKAVEACLASTWYAASRRMGLDHALPGRSISQNGRRRTVPPYRSASFQVKGQFAGLLPDSFRMPSQCELCRALTQCWDDDAVGKLHRSAA